MEALPAGCLAPEEMESEGRECRGGSYSSCETGYIEQVSYLIQQISKCTKDKRARCLKGFTNIERWKAEKNIEALDENYNYQQEFMGFLIYINCSIYVFICHVINTNKQWLPLMFIVAPMWCGIRVHTFPGCVH